MKFRNKKQKQGRQRRQPVDPDARPIATSYSYRTSRSEQLDNLGRDTGREPTPAESSKLMNSALKKIGLIVMIIVLGFIVINLVSLNHKVKVVSVSGDSANSFLHDESQYRKTAETLLASSVWNGNKITVNSENISQQLLNQYPELSSASLTLPLFSKTPILYIQTSPPSLVLSTTQGSYVVDIKGKALLLKENLSDTYSLNLPLVTDQSGIKVTLNKQVLTSNNVNFIRTVIAQLDAKKYKVSTMTLPVATSELDVGIEGQPYTVKFNLRSNDARQQVGTFLATISKLQSQNVTPGKYVDVRVDGRAYYQ